MQKNHSRPVRRRECDYGTPLNFFLGVPRPLLLKPLGGSSPKRDVHADALRHFSNRRRGDRPPRLPSDLQCEPKWWIPAAVPLGLCGRRDHRRASDATVWPARILPEVGTYGGSGSDAEKGSASI